MSFKAVIEEERPAVPTATHVEDTLSRHGVRVTPQRLAIGAILLSEPCHRSADQIIAALETSGHRVSKATVYNTLSLFLARGILRAVSVDPDRLVYDSTTGVHHHFYNEDTGELTDVDAGQIAVSQLPPLPEGTCAESVEILIRIRRKS
jgi:Fur family transcriptional regulator, iron response regulator